MMDYWIDNLNIETGYKHEANWINGVTLKNISIHIVDGIISEIVDREKFIQKNVTPFYKANGELLLPSFVDYHIHFDKSKIGEPWTPIKPAHSIIERFEQEIPDLEKLPSTIEERSYTMINVEKKHGVTKIRAHIDVEPMTNLRHFNAINNVKNNTNLSVETVIFPQHGLLRSNAVSLVEEALEFGADYIGGVDPYSLDGDYKASLAQTFLLAHKYNVGIDIHIHDRNVAGKETILEIIRLTKKYRLQDHVYISHAFGLNDFKGKAREKVFKALAIEKIHLVTSVPLDNNIPPILELLENGVAIHLGNDNVYDSWTPYGNGSLQEKLARLGEMYSIKDQLNLTQLLGLATDGFITLTKDGELAWPLPGQEASFMMVDSESSAEFVARQSPVIHSFNKGQLVL